MIITNNGIFIEYELWELIDTGIIDGYTFRKSSIAIWEIPAHAYF